MFLKPRWHVPDQNLVKCTPGVSHQLACIRTGCRKIACASVITWNFTWNWHGRTYMDTLPLIERLMWTLSSVLEFSGYCCRPKVSCLKIRLVMVFICQLYSCQKFKNKIINLQNLNWLLTIFFLLTQRFFRFFYLIIHCLISTSSFLQCFLSILPIDFLQISLCPNIDFIRFKLFLSPQAQFEFTLAAVAEEVTAILSSLSS